MKQSSRKQEKALLFFLMGLMAFSVPGLWTVVRAAETDTQGEDSAVGDRDDGQKGAEDQLNENDQEDLNADDQDDGDVDDKDDKELGKDEEEVEDQNENENPGADDKTEHIEKGDAGVNEQGANENN